MANKWLKWAALAAVVLALLAGAGRAFKARQNRQMQAEAAAASLRAPTVYELGPQDVVQARHLTLTESVGISGALRAAHTAAVKAKVAGELQGLQVREGDRVAAGQVLARIDTTEYQARVQQADQQAQAAAAQVTIAQRNLSNNQALVNQGFISKTALETSLANLDSAQANLRAAEAALDIARKTLADTALRSPITGQVASRAVQNGERVGVDTRVLEVVDLSVLELEAAVPPADAALLRVGQKALVAVEGLTQPVGAEVVRISPAAQAASRSVMVYLRLQAGAGLRHGLFAQGQVTLGQRSGVAIPATSVRNDRPRPYVQVVRTGPDGSAQVVHLPLQVLGQGTLPGLDEARHLLTDSVPEHTVLLSGTAGLMQERTAVRVVQAPPQTHGTQP
jgi:RND family efflux transporter MFP subunit